MEPRPSAARSQVKATGSRPALRLTAPIVEGDTFLGPLDVAGRATVGGATSSPGTGAGNTFLPSPQPQLSDAKDLQIKAGGSHSKATNSRMVVPRGLRNRRPRDIGGPRPNLAT